MKVISFSKQLQPQVVTRDQDGNLGVESIKTIITVLVTFGVDIIAFLKAKNYLGLISLIPRLLAQGNIIAIAEQAWQEIKDTSLEESNDIHLHFTEVLDLDNDETEATIEYAFSIVPRVYGFAIDALTFVGNVRAFIDEVRDRFGGSAKVVKMIEKVDASKLVEAA
ncbi:MAG: hypothetical protein AAF828_06670 [Bacteroidota bacterium]